MDGGLASLISTLLVSFRSRTSWHQTGNSAVVVLDLVIGTDGGILDIMALEDPDPGLTNAAIAAVKQWKFQPALNSGGKPVKVHTSITVRFQLKRSRPDTEAPWKSGIRNRRIRHFSRTFSKAPAVRKKAGHLVRIHVRKIMIFLGFRGACQGF